MTEETVPALDAVQPEQMQAVNEPESNEAEQNKTGDENKVTKEDAQERNWREANKSLKELRRQNEELRAHMAQLSTTKQETPEEQSSDDDWMTHKKFKKEMQELKNQLKAKEAETVVDRLKGKFTDFDDVVSPENVEYLKENDPELALSLQALRDDPYQQGLAAYKMLKKTDYYLNKETMKEKKKAEENQAKPPSVNQVRKGGALSEANKFDRGLTPELKAALLKEMNEARKGA